MNGLQYLISAEAKSNIYSEFDIKPLFLYQIKLHWHDPQRIIVIQTT